MSDRPLKIGITCYPSVGGSGILATALGEQLARRGHEVHFISYERPFRLPEGPADLPRTHFHPVTINDYGLFKYPDYTLPLSVRMAEVARDFALDVLHVHYAVPHATAAILARSMLPGPRRPRVVTTLHGTDTTLLGQDPDYMPAIRYALNQSDAVTAVSRFLERETHRLMRVDCPIEVIYNFFTPRTPGRSRAQVRAELGVSDGESLLLHCSNLRPVKRVDLLLEAAGRLAREDIPFKLVVLAGEDFSQFLPEVRRLGLQGRVVVRDRVNDVEEFMQAADLGVVSSDSESFCLSILEAMCFACPSVATAVGGIPEVIDDGVTGQLVPAADAAALAAATATLLRNPARRAQMGRAAQRAAATRFSAEAVVPQYEALYYRVCGGGAVERETEFLNPWVSCGPGQ